MPTYEYECETCGETFDVFQSIKARPLRKAECSKCGKVRSVRRLIGSGAAVLFKGSGFYETDYRSKSYTNAAKAERDKSSKPSSDNGKSSDSTGAASSDTEASSKNKGGPEKTGSKSGKSKTAGKS
jgi:putative FmdB family regulatory protein